MIRSHKRLTAATAALTALAGGLVLYVSLISASGPAYALDETVQANQHVTSYHVKLTPAAELGEAWVQLNPDGTPLRARMDLQSPGDGAKVVILSEGKAEVWFKDKKSRVFIPEKDALKRVMEMRNLADPKLVFEKIQADQKAGKVEVESKEPGKEGKPITLTVTPKDKPGFRLVYEVDPKTKLAKRMIAYRGSGDQWEQTALTEYLDYNQQIDPKVFQLELPEDVVTVDQIHRKPGLVKGDLSDEQMATKVVREFFEALIAEDYEKAGLILEGMPGQKIKEVFGRFKFFRIVEIGEPKPAPNPLMRALQVPAKVEWEVEGRKEVREFSPFVRPPHGQPDRRVICGGI